LTILLANLVYCCVASSFKLVCIHKYARFVFTHRSLHYTKLAAQTKMLHLHEVS
jgi:hypothetical protein